MATGNITLPDELLPQLEELARLENRRADDIVTDAVKMLLARRFLERNRLEASERRGAMTDEEVEDYVDTIVHEFRAESRER